jgi:small conductance mechanosensitive channel
MLNALVRQSLSTTVSNTRSLKAGWCVEIWINPALPLGLLGGMTMRILTLVTIWFLTCALAEVNIDAPSAVSSGKQIDQELQTTLNTDLEYLNQQNVSISRLEERLLQAEGVRKLIVAARLDVARMKAIEAALKLTEAVVEAVEQKQEVGLYRARAESAILAIPKLIKSGVKNSTERLRLSDVDGAAAEQAAENIRLVENWKVINLMYGGLLKAGALAQRLDVKFPMSESEISVNFLDGADSVSVFLELTLHQVSIAEARVDALPDDAELAAQLSVAEARVEILTEILGDYISFMVSLDLEVSALEQQLILADGQISTQTLDVGVIVGLLSRWGESLAHAAAEEGPGILLNVLLFSVIVYLAHKVSQLVGRIAKMALVASRLNLSQLLQDMIASSLRNLVLVLGVLMGLAQLGISLGPVLAGLGIIGFIVGFALQDTLSNLASGMLILVYRPFDVGDTIDTDAGVGTVAHMSLVNTTIKTLDNQTLIIPNNMIWQGIIKNLTAQKVRRVDMIFGISYKDNIIKAEAIFDDILSQCDMVLCKPEPIVRVHELGESSVNFIVRPWVKTENYWDVYWHITRAVKLRFDEEGVSIPFPQRDLHIESSPVMVINKSESVAAGTKEDSGPRLHS